MAKEVQNVNALVSDMVIGEYVQNLYPDMKQYQIKQAIKEQIEREFDFVVEHKDRKQKCISIYTKKHVYTLKDKIVVNKFDRFKMHLDKKMLEGMIKTQSYSLFYSVIQKFRNKNISKIKEVLNKFIQDATIEFISINEVEVTHKLSEFILTLDYHNSMITNIRHIKEDKIENDSIILFHDRMEFGNQKQSKIFKKEVFLSQLNLIDSNVVIPDKFVEDVKNNLINIKIDDEQIVTIQTSNCKYIVNNYNVTYANPKKGFNILGSAKVEIIEEDTSDISDTEYIIKTKVVDYYKDLKKAEHYIEKLGLSIKVITKFVTEDNIAELYQFITQDIIHHGILLYDNYMENCTIIKTKRFYYLIKNNVIINIRTINKEEIQECSIMFKKIYSKNYTEKENILDLEIGDKIRDFISHDTINKLIMKNHARERYEERISKKKVGGFIDLEMKNDIYKYGEVYMGTYYNNTKLIRGLKNIYIIDNRFIISVWKINPTIEGIEKRYRSMVEELTSTEVEDVL